LKFDFGEGKLIRVHGLAFFFIFIKESAKECSRFDPVKVPGGFLQRTAALASALS
jgi:hypothetical protein